MSSALSAVLQGLERGTGMGLKMYQALNEEARAKRQEQFQRDIENRRQFESDRAYERTVSRDAVADQQWQTSFNEGVRQFNAGHELQRRRVAVDEGNLALSNRKFQYAKDEAERQRQEAMVLNRANAALFGPDGQRLTGDALVERLNNDPIAMRYVLESAVIKGLLPRERAEGYSGMRLVPMGNGQFGAMVAGRDGQGNPIKEGGAPLTENGTADPDDPVMVFNADTLGLLLDPQTHRGAMRDEALIAGDAEARRLSLSSGLAQEERLAATEIAHAEDGIRQSQARLAELEARQAELENLPDRQGTQGPILASAEQGNRRRELRQIEQEKASLRSALDRHQRLLNSRPAQLEANRGYIQQQLEATDQWAREQRTLGGYADRRTQQQAASAASMRKARESTAKAVNDGVTAYNRTVKDAEKKLDANQVQAQLELLPDEVRVRLADRPGFLQRAVSLMGKHGVTSFDYLLDLTNVSERGLEHYYRAVGDEALTGLNTDQAHAVAKQVAEHMTQNPRAPYSAVLSAAVNGTELPVRDASLGGAIRRAVDSRWVAPVVRDVLTGQ